MKAYLLIIVLIIFKGSQAQLPHTFTQTARNMHYGDAMDVALGSDGTVFLANTKEGLLAYTYSGYTIIANKILKIPVNYELLYNYPNPFNPTTKIKFTIPKPEVVTIEVYNIIGQKISTLLNKPMPAGYHEVEFNGQNLSSGIYLYRIEAGKWQDVKKMLLIK